MGTGMGGRMLGVLFRRRRHPREHPSACPRVCVRLLAHMPMDPLHSVHAVVYRAQGAGDSRTDRILVLVDGKYLSEG